MGLVKVVTDSTSDLPEEVIKGLGITVVPLYVQFGTKTYRDRVDIGPGEFYERLIRGPIHPTTSATSVGDIIRIDKELAKETDSIISIHLAKDLSAIYNNALLAKEEVEKEGKCKIAVIDSRMVLMAMGFLAMEAARLALAGKNLDEIVKAVEENISKVHFLAIVDTLKYVERGGRVGKDVLHLFGSAVNLFKRKPVLSIKHGQVVPSGFVKAADRKEKLVEFVGRFPGAKEIALEYSPDATGEAARFAEEIREGIKSSFPNVPLYFCQASPVIGTHAGPGVLLVSVREG